MKLEDFLQLNYGYNPNVKNDLRTYIEQWKSWYQGNVKSFHNYFIYNGKKKVYQHRFTMNMAKEISEDWSDILWSEKCKISLKDDKSQNDFEELINKLDLYTVINQSIEKSGALGTEAVVISVYDIMQNEDAMYLDVSEAKTRTDLVDIDWIYPLSWNNKEITECAFGSVEYIKGNKYVILSVHKLADDGNYHIYNHLFKDTNGLLSEIKEDGNTIKDFDTKSNVKWFSIFKPLLTNNLFNNSPFGIPHYANAIDNMKSVDIAFDALKTEVKDGKRRIFARAEMFNYDDGQQRMVFDPEDTSIYQLPKGATKDDLIQSESDDLRTDKQISTLNTALNILGNKVGFGENHYHFDGVNLSTATAVVSSNSKLFRRKKKLEIGYESSIYDLVKAICYASSEFGKYNINTDEISIQFDDSIIEDKESEANRGMREVSAGLLSKVEYRMKIFGETEEVAKQKIEEIEKENPDVDDLLGTKSEKGGDE
ncbi:MAG: phage portal protein [Clostridia bacterium]|nr:phage portal protein [Clostridia bacterium]MBR6517126.1 phage portal protein [Bacilli bacterium]